MVLGPGRARGSLGTRQMDLGVRCAVRLILRRAGTDLELLESLREPTGAENSPRRRSRGSAAATEAERGSPVATAAGDDRALTSVDSSRLESSHRPSMTLTSTNLAAH